MKIFSHGLNGLNGRTHPFNPFNPWLIIVLLLSVVTVASSTDNWPHWRGPLHNGVSDEINVPLKWSPTQNIHWKLALPGRSGSTPIIWGDRIFVNVTDRDRIELWCVNRKTGQVMWKKPLGGGNSQRQKHNMSTPSPVTDGESLWVMTGTGLLRRFDLNGNELWMRDIQKEYGAFGILWGYGSSPLLYEDSLYVQVLHGMLTDDPSYILRIDKRTGKTMWRVERPTTAIRESPDSYTTPAIVKTKGGGVELIVTGGDCVTGHDLATGKELWRLNGLNPQNNPSYRIVASPVVLDDLVFAPSRERPLVAVRAGGRGDVFRSHFVWSTNNGPDVPTPVSDGKYLYIVRDNGVMFCYDARTGAEIYGRHRVRPGTYSASPVLADGKIFVTSEDGITTVVKAGPQFEVLAENDLNDYTLSSPVFVNGQIFMRTDSTLWAIGQARR
jgi:outer membrane protein assembly factor BamB